MTQTELPLPAPPAKPDRLVPARMVNEWTYCPRLAYLEWVEGEWAETADTAEGARAHTRSDRGDGTLPSPQDLEADDDISARARSVTLSSTRLGLIAKIDMVDARDGGVVPVDIKKGKRPHVEKGAFEPERVQVCAQAMILEDNGYVVPEGALWFAGSRERVKVDLDEALRNDTLRAASDLRLAAAVKRRPPPLSNSPKCPRCALAGICLPDETNYFRKGSVPRPLNPGGDTALPVYVQTPGARVRKSGERLVIETDAGETQIPLIEVSELALFGPVSLTTPTLHALFRQRTPVAWFSTGGWLMGHTHGAGPENAFIRTNQYRASFDEHACRRLAAGFVQAKIRNQRTMLRRNLRDDIGGKEKKDALARLKRLAERSTCAPDLAHLLGIEGEAAAIYFGLFPGMIKVDAPGFDFEKRNRRPPADPVNALLSFAYAVLTRTIFAGLQSVGFDPYRGFYHQPRHGRPALALDVMEPFRPLIADSAVLTVINNGEATAGDFIEVGKSCAMKPKARRALLAAFERRMAQEVTHPLFGYRTTTRRLIEIQCRLLARYLDGELDMMPHYVPR